MKKTFITLSMAVGTALLAQTGENLNLNGVNRYMKIPHHENFNFSTTQEFTASFWVNVRNYNQFTRFLSKRAATTFAGDRSGYEMWGANNATQFFALNTPRANNTNAFSQWGTIAGGTGTWIHLAFTVSRAGGVTTITQYQNGQIAKQSTNNPADYASTGTTDVFVGRGEQFNYYLNGRMDNLRFYNKALSQAEIQADMTATVTATTPNLIAGYDFENIDNGIARDITGRHNAILYNIPPRGASFSQIITHTGRGNDNEEVLKVIYNNDIDNATLNNLVISTQGTTNILDIEKIKVYSTGTNDAFDPRKVNEYELLGEVTPSSSDITINTNKTLSNDTHYFWITYKISENATEGNKVDAAIKSISVNNQSQNHTLEGNPNGSREILLRKTLVFAPGDYNSKNYRIPAIITAADGSLVAVNDKRKNHAGDLAADIDVVVKRSTDGGKTWSEPVTIAQGTGTANGYGDPLIFKTNSGKLIVLYVGGPGFFASTSTNSMRTYISESSDNGVSWSAPRDITSQIYGASCPDAIRSQWAGVFFSSGQGLTMSNGRLAGVLAVRESATTSVNDIGNFLVYSDDEGATWQVSQKAILGGDEAKVVELNNGNILLSARAWTRKYNISTDKGITWGTQGTWNALSGNPTNGDMIRYTSTTKGYNKDRILHTIPHANDRSNVRVFISYDEGTTWEPQRIISPIKSAYSSLTILPDGTIGAYIEEDDSTPYKLYFLNFSLDWLTEGRDPYIEPVTAGTEEITKENIPTIQVAPNPVSSGNLLTIVDSTEFQTAEFYDMQGRKVAIESVKKDKVMVPKLPKGVYIIKFTEKNSTKVAKILVK